MVLRFGHVVVCACALLLQAPLLGCRGEVFTALADMEALLDTEGVLLDSFHTYVRYQEYRLQQLERKYIEHLKEHKEAMKDVTNYLSNPINAFKVIKRLTTDWAKLEELLPDTLGEQYKENFKSLKESMKFPTDEDLSGAAAAMVRLQETYNLNTEEVAEGKLNGVQYSSPMTAHDCFELGRMSYNSADYDHTEKWMNAALQTYGGERNKSVEKSEILEYLAFSNYMMGDVDTALTLTNELLTIVPNHTRALGNIPHYEKALKDKSSEEKEESKEMTTDETDKLREKLTYLGMCRGDYELADSVKKHLKCRYVNSNHFLRLAPLKMEEHYLEPYIVLYHDVLYESEMQFLKNSSKPRFKRATVQDSQSGKLVVAKYRISKSAWFKDEEHKIVARISRRCRDISGLTMDTAEELQVVNYGIGGHYEPHYDFARKEETQSSLTNFWTSGNRIATILFYMSDVAQGGATVFPELGVRVQPRRGTAVFWHNLYPSGDGDYATRHAACPVLQGSKWVSNKWIHAGGQEFLRPCNLEYQVEGTMKTFPSPVMKPASSR